MLKLQRKTVHRFFALPSVQHQTDTLRESTTSNKTYLCNLVLNQHSQRIRRKCYARSDRRDFVFVTIRTKWALSFPKSSFLLLLSRKKLAHVLLDSFYYFFFLNNHSLSLRVFALYLLYVSKQSVSARALIQGFRGMAQTCSAIPCAIKFSINIREIREHLSTRSGFPFEGM